MEGSGRTQRHPGFESRRSPCLLCVTKLQTSLSRGLSFHTCETRLINLGRDTRCFSGLAHRKGPRNAAAAFLETGLLEPPSWPNTWPHRQSEKEKLMIEVFPAARGAVQPQSPASEHCPSSPNAHMVMALLWASQGTGLDKDQWPIVLPPGPNQARPAGNQQLKIAPLEGWGPAAYLTTGVRS